MRLSDIQLEAKKKPKQVKAKSKKPKIVKPNKGGSSKHPYKGSLVGENNKPKQPKQNNPVAKHSRNMSGAGAHKSPKDYNRKNKKSDIQKQLDEAPLVMPFASAQHIALEKTSKWISSHYKKGNDNRIDAYKKLGQLVGFDAEVRGKDSIVFNRFFTQTD
tara:strand:+ start:558 stop:1037 length:480 start_codon:yes stop_codon:yes gene_type:complete